MSDNDNLHLRAEVTIEEGKKEEYKKLIQRYEQNGWKPTSRIQ